MQINFPIGESEVLLNALKRIPVAAQCDVTVLLLGETGTGKEVFARSIHYQSSRHGKPFIPVNCGALPDHLFENEFFGHARGAYTDANTASKGLIAEAEGGTLFLDEIDALTPSAQIKLLRFLQDREYRQLGSSSALKADVRIIAATNAELAKKVEQHCFRQDLYYRLKAFPIVIPPLRERRGDVPLLADHFLKLFTAQYDMPSTHLSDSGIQKLMKYSWPGNVRELECTIQQAVLLSTSPLIQPGEINIPDGSTNRESTDLSIPPTSILRSLDDIKSEAVKGVERDYLVKLLSAHRGNISHAARAAGKERRNFKRLLRKHSLGREAFCLASV